MIWYKPRYVNYSEIDYPEHLSYLAGRPADRCDLGPASRRVLYAGGDRPCERRRRDRRPTYGTVQAGDIKYRDVNG